MQPLRVLVPSWRFFDVAAAPLALQARRAADAPWVPLPPPPRRRWYAALWNPAGNLALAEHAVVEQLARALAERFDLEAGPLDLDAAPADVRGEVEALLAFALAARQVSVRFPDAEGWRLVLVGDAAAGEPDDELLRTRRAP